MGCSFAGARVALAVRSAFAGIILGHEGLAGSLVLGVHRRSNAEDKSLGGGGLTGETQVWVHFATAQSEKIEIICQN